jgi:hypothetical protein
MVEASSKTGVAENRPRFERLRQIETEIQEMVEQGKLYEAQAPADHEKMDWATKNNSKFFATFPYPYMNGYLHLGKFLSLVTIVKATPIQCQRLSSCLGSRNKLAKTLSSRLHSTALACPSRRLLTGLNESSRQAKSIATSQLLSKLRHSRRLTRNTRSLL